MTTIASNTNDSETGPRKELAALVPQLESFIQHASSGGPDDASQPTFADLALRLYNLQCQINPVYRRFCQRRLPQPPTHWHQIPALPVTAFKEFQVTCLPPQDRLGWFASSATSGRAPSQHFHHPDSLHLYETSSSQWWRRRLAQTPSQHIPAIAVLTPPPDQAPHSSLVHMFATWIRLASRSSPGNTPASTFLGMVTAPRGDWTLDTESLHRFLQEACDANQPVALWGTAFHFVHFLDDAASHQRRYQLPEGSWVLETGGYKGQSRELPAEQLHRAIRACLGVDEKSIVTEYGMCELSSQAYNIPWETSFAPPGPRSCPPVFHFPPWARVRIVSPETGRETAPGELGLIQIYDLANAYSVMAIQTEDLGRRLDRGFQLLGRLPQAEPKGCSLQLA